MQKEFIAVTTNTGLTFIKRSAIMYCLSDGAYTNIYLEGGGKLTVSKNLKEVKNTLDDHRFVRIHHSHLINLDHTRHFINNGYNCVRMSNGEELAVSRNRKKEFLEGFVRL
ncbi:MAG: LytTR family DNA-binding domain-containing protein [Bacteroidota bacterium]